MMYLLGDLLAAPAVILIVAVGVVVAADPPPLLPAVLLGLLEREHRGGRDPDHRDVSALLCMLFFSLLGSKQ